MTQEKLPSDSAARKGIPLVTGCLDYFPLALAEVARVSKVGNDKHNPGEPLHWAREKSTDHADCIGRHLLDRGKIDANGMRHSACLAWRALANLELELEAAQADACSSIVCVQAEAPTESIHWFKVGNHFRRCIGDARTECWTQYGVFDGFSGLQLRFWDHYAQAAPWRKIPCPFLTEPPIHPIVEPSA